MEKNVYFLHMPLNLGTLHPKNAKSLEPQETTSKWGGRGWGRKFVADALIPFLIPFPQKNYCRMTERGIGVYEKRFLAA